MSSSVSFDFIENYLSWIRSKSSQKTIGDFEEITTPLWIPTTTKFSSM